MASVHKKGGKWAVRYRDPNGRQRSRSFSVKQDASKFAARIQVQMERGEFRDPALGRTSFADVAATWLDQKGHVRPGTRANLESILSAHLLPNFGSMQVAKITPSDVRRWVGKARADGVGASALAKAYSTLSLILEMSVEDRLIPSSPVPRRERPRQPEGRERRFLTRDQVDALADVIDSRYRALILTAAWTGLRFGELAGLRSPRLDLLRRMIDVQEQIVEVRGRLQTSAPKTKQGRRKVEIPRFLVPILECQLGEWSTEYVFPGPDGPLRQSAFSRGPWRKAVGRADMSDLTFHALRHTHAALSIKAGASVLALSRRLGHAKPSITLDVYSHLYEGADSEIAEGLDRLWTAAV